VWRTKVNKIKNISIYLSIYLPVCLWLCSPSLDLGRFFSFLTLYTVGKTPWTGDQPVARSLPTYRTTQTQNKRTHRYPCLEWDSNPRSCLRPRGHCNRLSTYSGNRSPHSGDLIEHAGLLFPNGPNYAGRGAPSQNFPTISKALLLGNCNFGWTGYDD
jgi:hypothetical protein